MTFVSWSGVALAFVLSLTLPIVIRPLLLRAKVIDVPNGRSSHVTPRLRGLGIAPLVGVSAGLAVAVIGHGEERDSHILIAILGASVLVGLLGILEDVVGVSIVVRAAVQFAVGAAATSVLTIVLAQQWWWIPLGALLFAGYTNAANFMDGIDGISGLHGAAVGGLFMVLGLTTATSWLTFIGAALAVAFAAFLPWNLGRSHMFLGDVGSYFLGASVSIVAIAAGLAGLSLLAVVSPLVIYVADTGTTLLGRVARGERWHEAHRKHVYQRLTDSGLSHLTVALVVTAFTLVGGAFGLLSEIGMAGAVVGAIGIVLTTGIYLGLPAARRRMVARPDAVRAEKVEVIDVAPQSDLPRRITRGLSTRWTVVGGTGFIGRALLHRLEVDHDAASLTAPRLLLSQDASVADLFHILDKTTDTIDAIANALRGVDVLVNAAGLAAPDSRGDDALFGANALMPAVLLRAAQQAGVARFIQLSSAAVQGRRAVLDESPATEAFSPYSRSKALGEAALMRLVSTADSRALPELVIVRATSVQGADRSTTNQLRRLARSPLASVARPGDQPTVVSSLRGLVEFVDATGSMPDSVPTIVLQPWEGLTTSRVLESAGGRPPRVLPAGLCRFLVRIGYAVGRAVPRVSGLVRRVELMWLGQAQDAVWARSAGLESNSYVAQVLSGGGLSDDEDRGSLSAT
jgi:UDP-N-acetylmuramyl pentapeptide phosphotransferase/UDP-N-acetylglucosamine-1-phosphate transferase